MYVYAAPAIATAISNRITIAIIGVIPFFIFNHSTSRSLCGSRLIYLILCHDLYKSFSSVQIAFKLLV